MSFFSLPLLSQDFLPLPCPSWLGGQVVQKLLLLSSLFFLSFCSINISFASIYPPSARDCWRQLLWGHSLRCKLPSLYSRIPSLVLVLGRRAPAAGDLPGVDYTLHRSRAVALTSSSGLTVLPWQVLITVSGQMFGKFKFRNQATHQVSDSTRLGVVMPKFTFAYLAVGF